MTDTDVLTAPGSPLEEPTASVRRADERRRGGLNTMVLAELRAIATELGIRGTSGLRKGDLIAAIEAKGGASAKTAAPAAAPKTNGAKTAPKKAEAKGPDTAPEIAKQPPAAPAAESASVAQPAGSEVTAAPEVTAPEVTAAPNTENPDSKTSDIKSSDTNSPDTKSPEAGNSDARNAARRDGNGQNGRTRTREGQNRENQNRNPSDSSQDGNSQGGNSNQNSGSQNSGNQNNQNNGNQNNQNNSDDDGDPRNRRGRRFRERRRGRGAGGSEAEPQVAEDDVLQPVAGILDVLDNYAFVRTSGYIAGPSDVYVSMNLVRKNGLRRGDALTGAVRVAREGDGQSGGGNNNRDNRQKFNPLVRLDTVNGLDVEAARRRPEFNKLTPLYPNERLRLETQQNILTTRVIDLIMPIGKGQRALISAPPKAGKTTIMQDIANAIAINNPECYLMVVLVDERPEEVTDMQRSVKGEVISSTFDRPPGDHTTVAELAIERAKRLVELGKDVVVLLDSITRLGRAYNNSSPASGRILSGGIDSTALYPPKRFLGAARNIENGGSLTIIATALVETGSTGDTVIFEEFKGTGNAELKLDRKIAERRVFPAVDISPSNTRKDELMMSSEEAAIMHKLRRLLSGLESQAAIDLLISQLKKTRTNMEFLMTVQKNAVSNGNSDND